MTNGNTHTQGGNTFALRILRQKPQWVNNNPNTRRAKLWLFFFTSKGFTLSIVGAIAVLVLFFPLAYRFSFRFSDVFGVVEPVIADQGFRLSPNFLIIFIGLSLIPIALLAFALVSTYVGKIAWLIIPIFLILTFFTTLPNANGSGSVADWAEARYGVSIPEIPHKRLSNAPFVNDTKTQVLVMHAKPDNSKVIYLYDFLTDKELPLKSAAK